MAYKAYKSSITWAEYCRAKEREHDEIIAERKKEEKKKEVKIK